MTDHQTDRTDAADDYAASCPCGWSFTSSRRDTRDRAADYHETMAPAAEECARSGHAWALFDEHPYWYDGRTYRCNRCHRIAYRCVDGVDGATYEHGSFVAVGHEWLLEPPPAAPCGARHIECVRCHLGHAIWPDVEHEWVYDNPNPALTDPEWAMGVGLVDFVGRRHCARCEATEYRNPAW